MILDFFPVIYKTMCVCLFILDKIINNTFIQEEEEKEEIIKFKVLFFHLFFCIKFTLWIINKYSFFLCYFPIFQY
jgi:hypothetical protein